MNSKTDFNEELKLLLGLKVKSIENSKNNIKIIFPTGNIQSSYWRLLPSEGLRFSSFDHEQQYGLPKPIDAVEQLRKRIENTFIEHIECSKKTGDLNIIFNNKDELQILNFTGYEVWEVDFEEIGVGQYSNYV